MGGSFMPKQSSQVVPLAQSHLVPRCVDGTLWMLYHVSFEQVLDDFGWFRSRSEAEAKIAELQRITAPARFVSLALEPDALN